MFREYMTDTAFTVRPTKNEWGDITSSVEAQHACRVENKRVKVITPNGNEVVASMELTFSPSADIQFDDTIKVNGVQREIVEIGKSKDFEVQGIVIRLK